MCEPLASAHVSPHPGTQIPKLLSHGKIGSVKAMEVLKSEYSAEPGSFLLTARVERRWDRDAFQRLQRAMLEVCREISGRDSIERWIADCFWYVEGFVREDCAHPDFPRPEPAYYEAAKRRTFDLSCWLFTGECPRLPSYEWPDL